MKRKFKLPRTFKNVLRGLAFVLVFLVLYYCISIVFTPKLDDEPGGMSNNITYSYRGEDKNTVDVVFIGNSDVARGINPAIIYRDTGITAVTVGPSAVDSEQVYKILCDIQKYQKPKVIVLEVDCLYGSANKYYKKVTDEYAAKSAEVSSIKNYLNETEDKIVSGLAFYSPLMKYHDRFCELTAKDFTNPSGIYKYSAKGYMYTCEINAFKYADEYMSDKTDKSKPLSERSAAGFEKIIDFCKENKISLSLLCVPSGSSWSVQKHNEIVKLSEKYNLNFVDYNTNPELLNSFSWETDTKDCGNHMNCYGAQKVTEAYEKHLKEIFSLEKSNLSAAQKKIWNEDTDRYFNVISADSTI